MSDDRKMKANRFAQIASRIANVCTSWAADSLDRYSDDPDHIGIKDVYRFTKQIRERLRWLEEEIERKNAESAS